VRRRSRCAHTPALARVRLRLRLRLRQHLSVHLRKTGMSSATPGSAWENHRKPAHNAAKQRK
jgi:hypothetical protein